MPDTEFAGVNREAWDAAMQRVDEELSPAQQHKLLNDLAMRARNTAVIEMRNRPHRHKTGETEKFLVRDVDQDTKEVYAVSPVVFYLEYGTVRHGAANGEFLYFENTSGQLIRKREVAGIDAQHNVEKLVIPRVGQVLLERINQVVEKVANGE